MRRLWIRSFALITIGLCGCQNTLDQQPRVISGPPGTSLQGVVSAPLAVPLSAAALGTRTLSTGYKPAGGVSVQVMLQVATIIAKGLKNSGYQFSIEETHHVSKLDSPSGTAISLAKVVEAASGLSHVPIEARREGDVMGVHTLEARGASDQLVLTHEAFSRRGFAEGAVRAAEWLSSRTGCYDFQDVYTQM